MFMFSSRETNPWSTFVEHELHVDQELVDELWAFRAAEIAAETSSSSRTSFSKNSE